MPEKKYWHISWNRWNFEKYRDIQFWSYRPTLWGPFCRGWASPTGRSNSGWTGLRHTPACHQCPPQSAWSLSLYMEWSIVGRLQGSSMGIVQGQCLLMCCQPRRRGVGDEIPCDLEMYNSPHSPLTCGWLAVVQWSLTARLPVTAFQSSDLNCGPLSKKRSDGVPNRQPGWQWKPTLPQRTSLRTAGQLPATMWPSLQWWGNMWNSRRVAGVPPGLC